MGNRLKELIAASFALLVIGSMAHAGCAEDELRLRGDWGQARFGIELASDEASRAKGLMHRESLPKSQGMLFVYNTPAHVTFWMRNTLISLDMIFADERGVVTHIHERAQPLSEELIPSNGEVLAVLEIGGGLADLYGINVGTEIQHPAFDPESAAWPCAK